MAGIFGYSSFDQYYERQLDEHLEEVDSDDYMEEDPEKCELCGEPYEELYEINKKRICQECMENYEY